MTAILSFDSKFTIEFYRSISHEEYNALVKRSRELEEKEAMDLKMAIEFSKLEMERLNAQAEEERRMLEEVKSFLLNAIFWLHKASKLGCLMLPLLYINKSHAAYTLLRFSDSGFYLEILHF